jgi:hypothetical protein
VHVVRRAVAQLDLSCIHAAYRTERGRPPFHPEAMVGLLLYGACRGVYSSRRLQAACRENVNFLYLTDWARPDFHTISSFRKRFQAQLATWPRRTSPAWRHSSRLDGTKIRANASKHKAMSYERLLAKRKSLE